MVMLFYDRIMGQWCSFPRRLPDGVPGYIYKIACRKSKKVYIGSTWERDLQRRLRVHEAHFRSYKRGKSAWSSSYEVLASGEYDITLLEECTCTSLADLKQHERGWYDLYSLWRVNRRRPYRWGHECDRQRREACTRYNNRNLASHKARCRKSARKAWKCDVCDKILCRGSKASHVRSKRHYNKAMGFV